MHNLTADAEMLWRQVLSQLRLQMARSIFKTWLRSSTGVDLEDDLLTVSVANPQAKDAITQRLQQIIDDAARRDYGRPLRTVFIVAQSPQPGATPAEIRPWVGSGSASAVESAVDLVEFDPPDEHGRRALPMPYTFGNPTSLPSHSTSGLLCNRSLLVRINPRGRLSGPSPTSVPEGTVTGSEPVFVISMVKGSSWPTEADSGTLTGLIRTSPICFGSFGVSETSNA